MGLTLCAASNAATTTTSMKCSHWITGGLALLLLISIGSGFPQYSPNDYDYDTNYADEEYGDDGYDDVERRLEVQDYNAILDTRGQRLEVTAGTTIRLECSVMNLSPDLYQSVIWSRNNKKNTIISIGETLLDEEYKKRSKVSMSETGSD